MAVRQSKVRHVFAADARKESSYEGFRITNCAFEGTFIAANEKFLAYCVDGGAGAFSVIPVDKTGRLDPNTPKICGHKQYVLDLSWNPFDDEMLATCSEDGTIRIWKFDSHGPLHNWDADKAVLALEYHQKRCTQVSWHPIAKNVLMSVSQEPKITLWDLDEGDVMRETNDFKSIIYNAQWSSTGDKIVASFKDKKFRIIDARSKEMAVLAEGDAHEGSQAQRVVFTFNDTMLVSCGFSKMSERQLGIWKINGDKIENLEIAELSQASGVPVPFYDSATQMVYLAAKGDSVITYYELTQEEPYFYYLNTFQAKESQKSICHIPKRSVDVNICEVMKFYRIYNSKTGLIKPVSFSVPRKSDLFQDDIYPDAIGPEAAIDAEAWFKGGKAEPLRVEMSTFFKGKKKPKGAASGGGLKKGGLKGLKAKKEAKEAAKKESTAAPSTSAPAPATTAVEVKNETKSPSPEPAKTTPAPVASANLQTRPSVDPKVMNELKDEIKTLKDNEKKMKREIKSLTDKLKDYDKLTGDIKLLCDAVKKNDERLNTLEALVQEESDEEKE